MPADPLVQGRDGGQVGESAGPDGEMRGGPVPGQQGGGQVDGAAAPDRSAPDVVVDNYLRAFLVDRNDARANLFT
ncbi:hypothetical protein ABZS39_21795, partial [Micromonospora luteifusca]